MLNHMSFGVSDLARSGAFYDAILAALGFARVHGDARFIGYGPAGAADEILLLRLQDEPVTPPGPGFHLCFDAPDRDAVDRFHAAGVATGGADNGPPGPRPQYGPDYYAAFLIDPDGHRLEAKAIGQ
jgi:catechol 2,3-dioxygenase-like lactoylglutathione lyase family enzyme